MHKTKKYNLKGERKMTSVMPINITEKFQSAEQMWFWFLYSKAMHNNLTRMRANATRRPCEVLDVETMITKLYLSGKLTDEQLKIMKDFGDKRRAPHQHIWQENRAAAQWRYAMEAIENAAKQRGWID